MKTVDNTDSKDERIYDENFALQEGMEEDDDDSKVIPQPISYNDLKKFFPFDEMRSGQEATLQSIEQALNHPNIRVVLLEAPTGCHAKGQGILMHSGEIKPVEEILVGELLMGPDSKPRKVLELKRGYDKLYKIKPTKGEEWVVNGDHILSIKKTREKKNGEMSVVNIPVKEYLKSSKWFKHLAKQYRVGVDFPISKKKLDIPPYIFGLWLGDGHSETGHVRSGITVGSGDPEIKEEFISYLTKIGEGHSFKQKYREDREGNKVKVKAIDIFASNGLTGGVRVNKFNKLLNQLGVVSGNKFIPPKYLTSNRNNRLELLAGLLDSDGSMHLNGFDFINKNKKLSDGVCFLARSLGLAAYMKECRKRCTTTNVWGTYFRVSISGNCDIIPNRLPRKKASKRKIKKDALSTGFKVSYQGEGEFFGFEVSGDRLYLLDDFTVTHNSGKSPLAITAATASGNAYIATANKLLQEQYLRDFSELLQDLKGRANYACYKYEGKNCGDSPCRTKKNDCTRRCGYHLARKAAVESDMTSMNFAAALAQLNYGFGFKPRQLMILDEAHLLPEVLTDFGTLSFGREPLLKFQLADDLPNYDSVEAYLQFISNIKTELTTKVAQYKDMGAAADPRELDQLESLLRKLIAFQEMSTTRDEKLNVALVKEYHEKQKHILMKVSFKPIQVSTIFDRFVKPHATKFVFLSATILDFQTYADILGLKPHETAVIRIGSNFPPKNRRIITNLAIGPLNQSNLMSLMPQLVHSIDQIMERYPDKKGIIHASSYAICNSIMSQSKYGGRILFPRKAQEQREILETHSRSQRPTVLLSPSMAEGVDLRGDDSRFQIIAKMPYPYLGDPVIQRRKELYPNYYSYKTILTLVQAYGRSIRSIDDYADTYILDKSFWGLLQRNRNIFPSWFLDAIEQ